MHIEDFIQRFSVAIFQCCSTSVIHPTIRVTTLLLSKLLIKVEDGYKIAIRRFIINTNNTKKENIHEFLDEIYEESEIH